MDANTIQHTALIRITRSVVTGDEPVADLFTKVQQLVGNAFNGAAHIVGDALETFVEQFASDFGAEALAKAEPLAIDVLSGKTDIKTAAITLGTQLEAVAITDAEKSGTVALNAIRVHLTAAATQALGGSSPAANAVPAANAETAQGQTAESASIGAAANTESQTEE